MHQHDRTISSDFSEVKTMECDNQPKGSLIKLTRRRGYDIHWGAPLCTMKLLLLLIFIYCHKKKRIQQRKVIIKLNEIIMYYNTHNWLCNYYLFYFRLLKLLCSKLLIVTYKISHYYTRPLKRGWLLLLLLFLHHREYCIILSFYVRGQHELNDGL